MTGPDKMFIFFDSENNGEDQFMSTQNIRGSVEYTRTAAHPVTVEMLEYWHSVMSNGIAADQIRAAIAAMKEQK